MAHGTPRDHHYVPQFYLRQFASDPERRKIRTVMQDGDRAIFAERSIRNLGYERDLYVHLKGDAPVNIEVAIGKYAENPLSQSDTWRKISSGLGYQLDESDRAVLYALIRHLESRNIHAREITRELIEMAANPASEISFTEEEREMYAYLRQHPETYRQLMNVRALRMQWTERDFRSSSLNILRSPIPLRTASVPVLTLSAAPHPALRLPLPGQTPFMYALTLNRTTLATLVLGDFGDAFSNIAMPLDAAQVFNRHYVGYFGRFKHTRHLVADDDQLVADMDWALFDLLSRSASHMKFQRRAGA